MDAEVYMCTCTQSQVLSSFGLELPPTLKFFVSHRAIWSCRVGCVVSRRVDRAVSVLHVVSCRIGRLVSRRSSRVVIGPVESCWSCWSCSSCCVVVCVLQIHNAHVVHFDLFFGPRYHCTVFSLKKMPEASKRWCGVAGWVAGKPSHE